MKQTLLLERILDQTRLAVVEDGQLCELYIESPDGENLCGNIYLGRVERVLPGMNAAFVNIGLEKNGFLAAADAATEEGGLSGEVRIEALARVGQEFPVQVIKSQPGAKGPRLSRRVTLAGRRMALLSGASSVGVSRKISDENERKRLWEIGMSLAKPHGLGVILRTAAADAEEAELLGEFGRLNALYDQIMFRAAHGCAPKLLHNDNGLALRAVRDFLSEQTDALWVEDEEDYERLVELARAVAPNLVGRILRHEGSVPLFDLYRVDAQAEKALQKFVWLKGGGSLVIEETEALTVVDVNTAKNVGNRSAEETIFENNCEAARELMRQLRLRDVGGIVVADFIDMHADAQRQALLEVLRECASRDRNRVTVVDITALGLVELTRKRERQSLRRQLTHTCDRCGANGVVPSHEASARRIVRELWRRRRGGDASALLLEASPPVCAYVRRIGNPRGGSVFLKPAVDLDDGEYRLTPTSLDAPPPESKLLK